MATNTSIPLPSAPVEPEAEDHDQAGLPASSAEGHDTKHISRSRRPKLSLRYQSQDFATDL